MSYPIVWAAGFFDGEGSTYVRNNRRGRPRIALSLEQARPEPLERFAAAVGGKVTDPYARDGRRPTWRWQVQGDRAEQVIALLYPWLSPPKREQIHAAEEALVAA